VNRIRTLSWKVPAAVIGLGILVELIDLPIGNVKNHQATSYKIGGALAGLGFVIFVIGVILLVIWAGVSLARRRRTAPAI
jgi:ABC-type transport system involved in cytochrome c biogenesis permease subunit